jgi:hypothetical protein
MIESLLKKLSDYIEEVGKDKAYITYTEGGLTVSHGILFMEDDKIYVISNDNRFNGSAPRSFEWPKYGNYSWCIAKREDYLKRILIEKEQKIITKEEICELLGLSPKNILIIKSKINTVVI